MHKVFIIAEAGVNHNGNINTAKEMIDAARLAGADAIKFQTFKAERLAVKQAPKAEYQKKTTDKNKSYFEMLKELELDKEAHIELMSYCKDRGITFLSTPFDLESVELLNVLGLKIFKIFSGAVTDLPYLRKIGALKKKIILSTGMSDLEEVERALNVLIESGTVKKDITLLHCNTEYPTPITDVNLRAMITMKNQFQIDIGYSDHTLGIEVPIAAVALGAKIIEKHFTLDKTMQGPDQKASIEPEELKKMVEAIRNIEKALGSGIKKPSLSELKNKLTSRKSVVALRNIQKGEILTKDNLTVKRPGIGINPMMWDEIIGREASKSIKKDELVEF
ncbi:MAG: N-acetylneuraminate synthase [Candidatus Omnitrophota bacterium]